MHFRLYIHVHSQSGHVGHLKRYAGWIDQPDSKDVSAAQNGFGRICRRTCLQILFAT